MRSLRALILAVTSMTSAVAFAQGMPGGPTPMALDLKKAAVGSWAEYSMAIGTGQAKTVKTRWALVARDASSNTVEMFAEGPPSEGAGKMVIKLVLVPD